MSVASCRSESSWGSGWAATGSVNSTVVPTLPSCTLMAWANAWVAGGCCSPGTTTDWPRWLSNSLVSTSSQCFSSSVGWKSSLAVLTPTRPASARKNPSTRRGSMRSRLSAFEPVTVKVASSENIRLIVG